MTKEYGRNSRERSKLPYRGEHIKSAVSAMSRRLAEEPDPDRVIDDNSLWYFITRSILSSQVRYEVAQKACERLYVSDLYSPNSLSVICDPCRLRAQIESTLTTTETRIRFARTRAQQLVMAFSHFSRNKISLVSALEERKSESSRREFLVKNIPGIGMKQGSMVLRDTAWARNLAIIDTHIINYMSSIHLLKPDPDLPTSATRYQQYEKQFVDHAAAIGEPVARLDQAAWWVMREIRKRGAQWI